jgi:AmmeMemoRadiSam system protein A
VTASADPRGAVLLALARRSIAAALGLPAAPMPPAANGEEGSSFLAEPGACFVTLSRQGRLRGCVGSVRAYRPLEEDVVGNARAAAFADPRFPPVTREEWPEIALEVSLLEKPRPLPAATEEDALRALQPGRDGVILALGDRASATFLPQVWEALPEPRRFLAELRQKAGLPAHFWSPELRLWVYRVEKWDEEG